MNTRAAIATLTAAIFSTNCGGRFQQYYDDSVHNHILDTGTWDIAVEAGRDANGLSGRVLVSGCADFEVSPAHDELRPIGSPAPTPNDSTSSGATPIYARPSSPMAPSAGPQQPVTTRPAQPQQPISGTPATPVARPTTPAPATPAPTPPATAAPGSNPSVGRPVGTTVNRPNPAQAPNTGRPGVTQPQTQTPTVQTPPPNNPNPGPTAGRPAVGRPGATQPQTQTPTVQTPQINPNPAPAPGRPAGTSVNRPNPAQAPTTGRPSVAQPQTRPPAAQPAAPAPTQPAAQPAQPAATRPGAAQPATGRPVPAGRIPAKPVTEGSADEGSGVNGKLPPGRLPRTNLPRPGTGLPTAPGTVRPATTPGRAVTPRLRTERAVAPLLCEIAAADDSWLGDGGMCNDETGVAQSIQEEIEQQQREIEAEQRRIEAESLQMQTQMQGGAGQPSAPAQTQQFETVHVPAVMENRCETFGANGALVRVVVGAVEVSARTDRDGRWAITQGSDLANLQAAGQSATVIASLRGKTKQTQLGLAGLDETAAIKLLDDMKQPTTAQVIAFVKQWRGTTAADLAVDRFGPRACAEFRIDWNEMMVSGDIVRITAVQTRYQGDWLDIFASACPAETRLYGMLEDLSGELGVLGGSR